VTGRLSFDRAARRLAKAGAGRADAAAVLSACLQVEIDVGRMPYDLALLLFEAATPAPPVPPPQADPDATRDDSGAADSGAADDVRATVDSGAVSALLGPLKALRRGEAPADDTSINPAERQLDAALDMFRGARARKDARASAAGHGRTLVLGSGRDAASMIGGMLRDRFVLDRELGRGGMGAVYRAVDRRRLDAGSTRPYVALKLLHGEFSAHADALRSLETEARRTMELAHPNIVTVHDFDRDGAHAFIVMELLDGRSLDAVLYDSPDFAGSPAAFSAIRQILTGLAFAHARGVVHSDLKLANLFFCDDGTVKVLDFGIASAARAGEYDPAALDAMTPAYASPERLRGAPRDPRDDLYGLACIIHLLLTGNHPFGRLSALDAIEQGLEAPDLPMLPPRAAASVARALSFSAAHRPADAGAFLAAYRDGFRS